MPNTTIYHWGDDHLQIKLGNRTAPRIKALFWGEFLVTLGMSTIFLLQALPIGQSVLHILAASGSATLYLLASYRFISRTFYTEELWLDDMFLTVISSTPFKRKLNQYDWDNIGLLHYIGKDTKTDHPLKGQCYDYFGFETQESLSKTFMKTVTCFFIMAVTKFVLQKGFTPGMPRKW